MANLKKGKRRKLIVFAVIIGVVAMVLVIAALKHKDPAITVQKEKVTRRDLIELVKANGKIQPVVQVKISPEVSGEIIELPVKEGQAVKKGDLLVKIKPDNYVATRNSSAANFKLSLSNSNTAWANMRKSELEFQRNDELFQSKLISDSAYLDAKTTYDVAKATLVGSIQQVEMACASLQNSENDLAKTTIYSPLDGTVTKLNSQLGERVVGTAMMAGTEIMTVSDLNEMEAVVDIGEIDVVWIAVGQIARLDVDAFKDRKFNGKVTEIANSSNNSGTTGTAAVTTTTQEATKFQVKIRVAEKEAFRPGMSVTTDIETRYRTNVLTVPFQSVTTRLPKDTSKNKLGQTNVVQVAAKAPTPVPGTNDTKTAGSKKLDEPAKPVEVVFLIEGDHVKSSNVKRGISDDNYTEIVDGLKEGEEVVSGGYKAISRELEDGKKVTVGPKATGDKDEKKVN